MYIKDTLNTRWMQNRAHLRDKTICFLLRDIGKTKILRR